MTIQNRQERTIWVDYLRSFITVLVVAHHSSLAYTTFARFESPVYINSTHPVVDTQRWIGLDIFQNFNDIFFMSLMFLIGGLFLPKNLESKGSFVFIKDRLFRLFLPFIIGGSFLMLLAYFPSYYLVYGNVDVWTYIKDFFFTEDWPAGPSWFIWVLLLFNLIFALSYHCFRVIYSKIGEHLNKIGGKPHLFLGYFLLLGWVLYVPVAYHVNVGEWVGIGPFDFQLSRIILYFGYFFQVSV